MSRTKRKNKSPGYDFWSRRCFGNGGMGFGKSAKWITKKKERARNKRMCIRSINDPEKFEKRFPGE